MESLEKDLKHHIRGEVRFDEITRQVYSVDASIYEIVPLGVVIPIDTQDLLDTIKIAYRHKTPIIPRGAATGITGGCIGHGLIIDLSKYLNKILEINYEDEYVICQPGVVQDVLNSALAKSGYRLGPDTSTGNRATIGGMLANNAAGARSLYYGKMVDHVLAVKLALADGTVIHLKKFDNTTWNDKCLKDDDEGRIYRAVNKIKAEYRQDIIDSFPHIPRRVSGYNLDELVKEGGHNDGVNLAKLIAGSEGTLGIATEITLKIVKKPRETGLSIIHFNDFLEGMKCIEYILSFSPLSAEMIDSHIMQLGRSSPALKDKLSWLKGTPAAIFAIEFEGQSLAEVKEKLAAFEGAMRSQNIGYEFVALTDSQDIQNVWEVRKAGLGLLLSRRTYNRAIAFIEDISIPPKNLHGFMKDFKQCLKKYGKDAGIYGHVGSGCMHVRPFVDLRDMAELNIMRSMMLDVAKLVQNFGGALSGEHGDGLVRSWLNKMMFGERLYQAFIELKEAFDPDNLLNPHKIVNGPDLHDNLRLHPGLQQQKIHTFQDFSKEGGFELSVDMCNGNGLCRKKENTMCPSFQASDDEYHSTRARAQSLRAIINGRLPKEEFTGDGLYSVLDLCLECKGCKKECPSQVDMAKMKAEFLYHYFKKRGYPLRSYLFAYIGPMRKIGRLLRCLSNKMQNTSLASYLLEKIGITSKRQLPEASPHTFSYLYKKSERYQAEKKIVLFNDTYTEFFHPSIGLSAVKVLNLLGYEVIAPQWKCCGRPHISKGMLPKAKMMASEVITLLHPYAMKGIPIIGLEPSCLFTLNDDFLALIGHNDERANLIAKSVYTLDQFLEKLIREGVSLKINREKNAHEKVLIHTHCYQKALSSSLSTLFVLKSIAGLDVEEIASGCCGMAGSFGYESEHYDFSLKIGELKLFPAVRNTNATIIANGMSCRSQISHGTHKTPLHLAEFLSRLL